ncbi:MAG: hypothetical protein ACK4S4_05305 [Pyrinomonadaceae bacterium]
MRTKIFCIGLLMLGLMTSLSDRAAGQRRDYMTEEEIELVRDAQDIDERIEVLTAMIERRFTALKTDTANPKPIKESEKWGPAPSGTRLELLDDIRRLIQKAIDDIDNSFEHPTDYSLDKDRTEKQKKRDAQRFPAAVRSLAASSRRYLPVFKTLLERSKDEREKGVIIDAIESCEQVIDAAAKLPAEPKDK